MNVIQWTQFTGTPPPWRLSILDSDGQAISAALNSFNQYNTYLPDVGAANALTVTLPAGATLTAEEGLSIQVKVISTNTGATTITITAIGTYPVVTQTGAALAAGALQAGGIYNLQFDGARFQVVGGVFGTAAAGIYNPTFLAGQIQYCGPGNTLTSSGQFWLGLSLPNASGTPCPALQIGGAQQNQAAIITDAQVPGQKGITLIIEAGDSSATPGEQSPGGDLLLFAGGCLNALGATMKVQGGTSVSGQGGASVVQGGNSTNGPAGHAYLQGGVTGTVGGNAVLLPSILNGQAGVIQHRWNSAPFVWDEHVDGSWFFYDISGQPARGGFGLAGQCLVSGGPGHPVFWKTAYTGDIAFPGTGITLHVASGLITGFN